jgi:hypothetical protein
MSSGDGHGYITFGWVATICYLLLFAAIQHSQRPAIYQSTYYQEKCAGTYPDSPIASIYAVPDHPEPEPDQSDTELSGQPDWCDLAAQQGMAEDTASMRRVAWFGFFSGVAGIWLLIWTLRENRRISEATLEANRIAKKAFIAQNRPWVSIKSIEIADVRLWLGGAIPDNRISISYRFTLENTGPSPALFVNAFLKPINIPFVPEEGHPVISEIKENALSALKNEKGRAVAPKGTWVIDNSVLMTASRNEKSILDPSICLALVVVYRDTVMGVFETIQSFSVLRKNKFGGLTTFSEEDLTRIDPRDPLPNPESVTVLAHGVSIMT